MTRRREPPYSLSDIFRIPLSIALLSTTGLLSALVGDGWPDLLSWLMLAIPLAVAWRKWRTAFARKRNGQRTGQLSGEAL